MPLYEYECTKCGHRVEKIQKFSDAPLTRCEECGGKLKRLLSSPAIQFKGSGWYVTDYAKKSAPVTGSKAENPSDGGGAKAGESTKKEEKAKTEPSKK